MADETQKPEESSSGITWTDVALVGISLAAIPFTGGLSAAGLGLAGAGIAARFGATRLIGAALARSGTNVLARSFASGATAPAGTAARTVAGEAFKDGAGAAASGTWSTLRGLFMKPAQMTSSSTGQVVTKTYGKDSLLHKAGDTVYELSKGRAVATAAGALAVNSATDGAVGRLAMRAGETVASGVGTVAGTVVDGAGRVATDADNRYTGGQGQQLLNGGPAGTQGAGTGAGTQGGSGQQQEETVVEQDENGVSRSVPRSQSQQFKLQNMLQGMMDKAKNDPFMALGVAIGGITGMKSSNGMMEAAWKVPLYAAMFGFIFKMLGPIVGPLIGFGKDMLQNQFHGAQVKPYAGTPAPVAPAADAADKKPATTGEDGILALLRQNGHDVTQSGTTPAPVLAARVPGQRLEQVVPA